MTQPKYKRILLKLSGEALMGPDGYGIDLQVVRNIAEELKEVRELGVELATHDHAQGDRRVHMAPGHVTDRVRHDEQRQPERRGDADGPDAREPPELAGSEHRRATAADDQDGRPHQLREEDAYALVHGAPFGRPAAAGHTLDRHPIA